jgi:hypothetical protein
LICDFKSSPTLIHIYCEALGLIPRRVRRFVFPDTHLS